MILPTLNGELEVRIIKKDKKRRRTFLSGHTRIDIPLDAVRFFKSGCKIGFSKSLVVQLLPNSEIDMTFIQGYSYIGEYLGTISSREAKKANSRQH